MTGRTEYPSVVVVGQYSVTDTEIHRCQVTGLDRGWPAYVVMRRWVDGTGCIRERLRVLYDARGVQGLAERHASNPEALRRMGIPEALRLIEEAVRVREAEEAEALESQDRSDIALCEKWLGSAEWCASNIRGLRLMGFIDGARVMEEQERRQKAKEVESLESEEGLGLREPAPVGDPGGRPAPAHPVTPGPADAQSDPEGDDQRSSPGPPSADLAYRETDSGGAPLTEEERRARVRRFVDEVGRYITSEQPEGMPVGEWCRKVLQELRCTDWYEVLLDPRVRRGQWGHVWEAMGRAKVKVAGPVAP